MVSLMLMLPDELLLQICKQSSLSVEDTHNASYTCKRLRDICESEDLWKSKFINRWPWISKKILKKGDAIKNWKKEVCAVKYLAKKLHEKIDTLSYELYKYKDITSPLLVSFVDLANIGVFGSIYILNELREILVRHSECCESPETQRLYNKNMNVRGRPLNLALRPSQRPNWVQVLPRWPNDSTTGLINLSKCSNLTKEYYTDLLLPHIHQMICQEEWKVFFSLPEPMQNLERASFYFAKWFQPIEFLDIEFEDIKNNLDELADLVVAHLKGKCPTHPIVCHPLIDPDEPLPSSLWSKKECDQILRSINHVIYTVSKFQGNEDYYHMDNSFINTVLETKKGIPVTLSILYQSVCHRLGIALYPVNCPSHFMMKWRVPEVDRVEYIDAFNEGRRTEADGISLRNHPSRSVQDNWSCPTRKVLVRMANNTIHVGQRNHQTFDRFMEMCLAAEIATVFDPANEDVLEFTYSLYLSCELHPDRIIAGCAQLSRDKPHMKYRLSGLERQARLLLETQKKGPKPVLQMRRLPNDCVKFATGMVMSHKLYGYTCVITGWDTTCKMPNDWIIQMNVLSLQYQDKQPFYNVLVADGSQRYAAQENLLCVDPAMVLHKEVGKYFKSFNSSYYVPNQELEFEYPDEDEVRRKFYPQVLM